MVHLIQRETFSAEKWNGKHASMSKHLESHQAPVLAIYFTLIHLFLFFCLFGCFFHVFSCLHCFGGADFLLPLFPPVPLFYHPHWLKYKVSHFRKLSSGKKELTFFLLFCLFVFLQTPEQMEPFRAPDVSSQLPGLLSSSYSRSSSQKWLWRLPGSCRFPLPLFKPLGLDLSALQKPQVEQTQRDQAVEMDFVGYQSCASLSFVLQKRFQPSLLGEVPHMTLVMKKQSSSEACSECGVIATSLFFRGKTVGGRGLLLISSTFFFNFFS